MILIFNSLLAIGLELSAVSLVFFQTPSLLTTASFLFCHVASCCLAGFVLTSLLPDVYRKPRRYTWLFLVGYLWFIPFLALAVAGVAIITSRFWAAQPRALPLFEVLEPITYHLPSTASRSATSSRKYGEGGLRSRLHNTQVQLSERVKTILSLQNMSTRIMNPMLRESLSDQTDDIRLLAYGLLDRQEKQVNQRIHQELMRFQNGGSEDKTAAARHIAELYWELIYQGLALGDLKTFAAQTALRYLYFILEKSQATQDAGLYFLQGRILDTLGQYDLAEKALQKALSLGLAPVKAIPYLAEIAYKQGNYAATRSLLQPLEARKTAPVLAPVIQFWQSQPNLTAHSL